MINTIYPDRINIAKSEFEICDDYYDDVIVWDGEPKDDKHIGYVRADLVRNIEKDRDYSAVCVEIVQAEYDEYKKKYGWHDASKELPSIYDDYLVRTRYGITCISHYNADGWHHEEGGEVIAWMTLPPFNTDNQ